MRARRVTSTTGFKGHSIFFSIDNADPEGSLEFGRLLGEQLKGRGLQYTAHYIERFMGHRQRLLVDANVGVYRYDQLIVLKSTHMPAVLLEAGSIINRDEELVMNSPERQSLVAAAVTEAVDGFCAVRSRAIRTVLPPRRARPPSSQRSLRAPPKRNEPVTRRRRVSPLRLPCALSLSEREVTEFAARADSISPERALETCPSR
jgi:hypothetical protein